jgi:hypothetical protein
MTSVYPLGGKGGIVSDLMTSDIEGLRRLKTQTLNYRDDLISRGYGFYLFHEATIPTATKRYLEFTTPSDRYFALNFRQITTDKERLFYRVYTNYSGVTASTSVRIGNLKPGSSVVGGSTYTEATGTPDLSSAIAVTILPIFGQVNAGNRASGSLLGDSVFRLIPPDTSFLIELDNQSADAIYVNTELVWAEIPQSLIIDGGLE